MGNRERNKRKDGENLFKRVRIAMKKPKYKNRIGTVHNQTSKIKERNQPA